MAVAADAGGMESDEKTTPAWMGIVGWAAAAGALVFIVVGAVFLQPSGDRSIEVSKPFDVGLGLDSFSDDAVDSENGDGAEVDLADGGDGLVEDRGVAEAGVDDAAPEDLSFVDGDELPPPLVDDSPLEGPELADDGFVDDAPEADQPVAEAPTASADGGFTDSFDAVGPPWTALSGSWLGSGGRFVQQDTDGFDLIAQLELDVPESYRLSVVVAPLSGALSAGVLIGQQENGDRAGAYLVDFSDDGTFVRLGKYAAADATYEYIEGLAVPEGFDPAGTHTLAIVVEPTDTTVFLDGEFFTTFGAAPAGRVGLVTNGAATAFDDFVIEAV